MTQRRLTLAALLALFITACSSPAETPPDGPDAGGLVDVGELSDLPAESDWQPQDATPAGDAGDAAITCATSPNCPEPLKCCSDLVCRPDCPDDFAPAD